MYPFAYLDIQSHRLVDENRKQLLDSNFENIQSAETYCQRRNVSLTVAGILIHYRAPEDEKTESPR